MVVVNECPERDMGGEVRGGGEAVWVLHCEPTCLRRLRNSE